jgi:hypothetical protein
MKHSSLLLACLLAGCASGPVVQVDHDPEAQFLRYGSYAWLQEPPIRNPLLKQRIVGGVDAQLAARGWRKVPMDQAQVMVAGDVSAREDLAVNYYYEGNAWTGGEWRAGGATGMQRMDVRSYKVGTLVIDMFDASSRRAIWRATAEGAVPASEAHQNRDAQEAVQRMFRDFPPQAR